MTTNPWEAFKTSRIAANEEEGIESLLQPLRELQGRFRLEVPESFVKEERIREANDQRSARYIVTWYDIADLKEKEGVEPVDLEPVVDELAEAVLGDQDEIEFKTEHQRRGRHTHQSTVSVTFKSGGTTAGTIRLGRDIVPPDTYPVTLYIGEDVFGIDSDDGVSFRITENGEVLADGYESAPDAFGAVVTAAIDKLKELEASKGRDDQLTVEQELLIGIADYYLNSETISEDAKEHLIAFVELVTNRDLMSSLDEED